MYRGDRLCDDGLGRFSTALGVAGGLEVLGQANNLGEVCRPTR